MPVVEDTQVVSGECILPVLSTALNKGIKEASLPPTTGVGEGGGLEA